MSYHRAADGEFTESHQTVTWSGGDLIMGQGTVSHWKGDSTMG